MPQIVYRDNFQLIKSNFYSEKNFILTSNNTNSDGIIYLLLGLNDLQSVVQRSVSDKYLWAELGW